MNKFTKKLQAVAVAAALGVGMAGGAQAGVIAQSVLEVTNLTFYSGAPGGTVMPVTALGNLSFVDNSDVTATLNGVTATTSANSNVFGLLDVLQQCVGACGGFGQNDYSHRAAQTVVVARGDAFLNNSPVSGTGFPVGANARTVAEAQVVPSSVGSVTSNLGLLSSFTFVAGANTPLGIQFNADKYLIAGVTADMGPGSNAQATSSLDFSLRNLTTSSNTFKWAPGSAATGVGASSIDPCLLNDSIAINVRGITNTESCIGQFSAQTGNLIVGNLYQFNIKHVSLVDAAAVPEPETLGLLGIGMLGLVAGLRRRKAKVVA